MPSMTSLRDPSVDIAKGIGILFVIGGHCGIEIPDLPTYSFHIPLFYFVSGFFLTGHRSFGEELAHKTKKILIPYCYYNLFFGILSFLLSFIGITWAHPTLLSAINFQNLFINPFLSGHQFQISCPLWFVPSVFLVGMLFHPLAAMLEKFYQSKLKTCILVLCLLCVYYLAVNTSTFQENIPLSVASRTLIGLVFCILGNFYFRNKAKIPPFVLFMTAIFVYAYFSIKYGGFNYSLVWNDYGTGIGRKISFFVSLSGLMIFISLSDLMARNNNSSLNNFFIFLGQNSFHIMAIHLSFFLVLNIFISAIIPVYHTSEIRNIYFQYPHIKWIYFLFSTLCCYKTIFFLRSHANKMIISPFMHHYHNKFL